MAERIRVTIRHDGDIVAARQQGRALAVKLGFSSMDGTLIATAISELARNIQLYAKQGEIVIEEVKNDVLNGIRLIARDEGPGIPDVDRALQSGYSTSGGLGLGLSGVRRCMHEFRIESQVGHGTVISAVRWRH